MVVDGHVAELRSTPGQAVQLVERSVARIEAQDPAAVGVEHDDVAAGPGGHPGGIGQPAEGPAGVGEGLGEPGDGGQADVVTDRGMRGQDAVGPPAGSAVEQEPGHRGLPVRHSDVGGQRLDQLAAVELDVTAERLAFAVEDDLHLVVA